MDRIQDALARLEKLEKAAVLTSSGGVLNTEQQNRFLSGVVDQTAFLGRVERINMSAETRDIDILDIATRQMRAGTEGVDPGFTADATFTKRTLTAKKGILPFDVSLEWIEDNLEGNQGESTLNQKFSMSFGNNMLDLGCNGDEADADLFINQNDGWVTLAEADGAVNSFTSAADTNWLDSILPGMWTLMPAKWRNRRSELKFIMSPDDEDAYRDQLRARETSAGDEYLIKGNPTWFKGVEVLPVDHWPTAKPMLTIPRNLKWGVRRNIRVDRFWNARKQVVEYTITARFDYEYALSEMIVQGNVS